MALSIGAVTVNYPSADTTSGIAARFYTARRAAFLAGTGAAMVAASVDMTKPPAQRAAFLTAIVNALTGIATQSVQDATVLFNVLTLDAVVTTTVSVGGLQNTPNPNNPATPTAAPGGPVNLTGSLS